MKILITTGIFPPDIGGPATQIDAFCRALVQRGHQPLVLTFGQRDKKPRSYPVIKISKKIIQPLRNLIYGLKIFQIARKVDLIYTQDLYTAGFYSFLASKLWHKKLISRFAGDSAWETTQLKYKIKDDIISFQIKKYAWPIELKKFLRKIILTNSSWVIAVSHFMADLAVKIGVAPARVKMIYNSVEFMASQCGVASKFQRPVNAPVLITAGRLVSWKNMDVFIRLMPELIKKYHQINLLILGAGPEEKHLRQLVKELNLEKFVKILGRVPQEKIADYFCLADIFILNTNYEGLSHTILEAMSLGLPIITTKIGGNPEIIQNGQNGFLVEYNNSQQWQEAIISLLDNADLRQRFIEQGKKSLSKFNWQSLIEETLAVFEK